MTDQPSNSLIDIDRDGDRIGKALCPLLDELPAIPLDVWHRFSFDVVQNPGGVQVVHIRFAPITVPRASHLREPPHCSTCACGLTVTEQPPELLAVLQAECGTSIAERLVEAICKAGLRVETAPASPQIPSDNYGRVEPPHGYAYRYPSVCGGTVVSFDRMPGREALEVIPYWLGSPVPGLPTASTLPELNDEVRWILGRPNFACAGLAECLRRMGHSVAPKAEDEQAAAIHWMLDLYMKHGTSWRDEGQRILHEARRADEAKTGDAS